MSQKKISGHHHVCAVRNCFIKGYNSKKKFYRFPKDINRARIWAMKANREDLLGKLIDLHKSYSLCENHFEERMFTSHLHTRLVVTAIPTLFASLEWSSRTDHSYNMPPLQLPAKIPVLDDSVLVTAGIAPALFDPGSSFLDVTSRSITSCCQESAVQSCSNSNDNLNMMLNRYPTSVISDISQTSTSSILNNNQLDISKISDSSQNNFGNNTGEDVTANDNFDDKEYISYSSTSVSAPSLNSTCTGQSLNNIENNGGSGFHSIMNCKMEDHDCVVNEDTTALWHFNYLPERQGSMKVDGDRPQQLRWFELCCRSVT